MPTKLIRDFITGEYKEVPCEGSGIKFRIPAPGAVERTYLTGSTTWPMVCMNAATDPKNIKQEQQLLKQRGVTTEYTPTGEPIFRSPSHRKAHCEAIGLYDRNAGYGDPQPRNFVASDFTQEAKIRDLERLLSEYD